jgi:hypothetical protein
VWGQLYVDANAVISCVVRFSVAVTKYLT